MVRAKSGIMAKLYTGEEKRIMKGSVPVDPEKLKKLFIKRDMMATEASIAIGYAPNTLSAAIYAGVLAGPMVAGLERLYGIKPEEYEYKPESVTAEINPEEKQAAPISDEALYATMKNAMLDAINEALAGNMKNLRGMVMAAVQQALKPV